MIRKLKNPATGLCEPVIDTGHGDTLCLDLLSGQYFLSCYTDILRAQNDVNDALNTDTPVNLNEFYALLGIFPVKYGDDLGWNVESQLDISFSSALTEYLDPVLVIDYNVYPEYYVLSYPEVDIFGRR